MCRPSFRTRELTVSEIRQAGKSLYSSSSLLLLLLLLLFLDNHISRTTQATDKSTPNSTNYDLFYSLILERVDEKGDTMEHSTRLIQLGSHLFYNTHAHVFEYPIIRNHNITQLSLAS